MLLLLLGLLVLLVLTIALLAVLRVASLLTISILLVLLSVALLLTVLRVPVVLLAVAVLLILLSWCERCSSRREALSAGYESVASRSTALEVQVLLGLVGEIFIAHGILPRVWLLSVGHGGTESIAAQRLGGCLDRIWRGRNAVVGAVRVTGHEIGCVRKGRMKVKVRVRMRMRFLRDVAVKAVEVETWRVGHL